VKIQAVIAITVAAIIIFGWIYLMWWIMSQEGQ